MYKELGPEQIDILVGSPAVNDEFSKKIRELDRRLQANGMSYRDWETLNDRQHDIFADNLFLDGECATSVDNYVMGAVDSCWCPDVIDDLHHHSPVLMREIEKQQEMLPDMKVKIGESLNNLNETLDLLLENVILQEFRTPTAEEAAEIEAALDAEEPEKKPQSIDTTKFNAELAAAVKSFLESPAAGLNYEPGSITYNEPASSTSKVIFNNLGNRSDRGAVVARLQQAAKNNEIEGFNLITKDITTKRNKAGGEDVNGITLVPVSKEDPSKQTGGQLILVGKQGSRKGEGAGVSNIGNVQEAYVAAAIYLLFIDPTQPVTPQGIEETLDLLVQEPKENESSTGSRWERTLISPSTAPENPDEIILRIGFDQANWDDISDPQKRQLSMQPTATAVAELMKSKKLHQAALSFYNDNQSQKIASVASGVEDQTGTKVDWYLTVNGYRYADTLQQFSIKGFSRLLGQVGATWDDSRGKRGLRTFYKQILQVDLGDSKSSPGKEYTELRNQGFKDPADVYAAARLFYNSLEEELNAKLAAANSSEEGDFLADIAAAIRREALGQGDEGPVGFLSIDGDTAKFLDFFGRLTPGEEKYVGNHVSLEVASNRGSIPKLVIYDTGEDGANLAKITEDARKLDTSLKDYLDELARFRDEEGKAVFAAALPKNTPKNRKNLRLMLDTRDKIAAIFNYDKSGKYEPAYPDLASKSKFKKIIWTLTNAPVYAKIADSKGKDYYSSAGLAAPINKGVLLELRTKAEAVSSGYGMRQYAEKGDRLVSLLKEVEEESEDS